MGWSRDTIRKVAKRTGYPVFEAWSGHNAGVMGTIYGPMLHHTGTPASTTGDYPTLRVVRDGRPGLENSLCMFGLGKSGTIYLINDKISWHAGAGSWNGVTDGNGHFAGIEAEGPGTWSAAQIDSYQRLVASILIETGRDTNWMPTHAQFALPRGRKTDPTGIDMNAFRAKVQKYLANPGLLGVGGGDDMYDDAARQELIGSRIDQTIIPTLKRIEGATRQNRPFSLYRYAGPTESDLGEGSIYLAGEGMWWPVPNMDVLNLITVYGLAGEALNVGNKAQWDLIKLLWSMKAPKVDVSQLNAAVSSLSPTDLQRIAEAVNNEDDRRDRDDNPATGARS